ncbi:MAG: hypothetical protein P0Y56_13665 [Candidatus Andeanibacterium colombiense]|uniref:Uncharacterized protein n=1 Tax=Candidatus Andeanibacterium colombiense TaxID=3121345 RepID=A0AAJ6BM56_9SPHN|nr:MAG: hypothetical protein P0Y56_13665 [Sphingomonadaceae bacterium]
MRDWTPKSMAFQPFGYRFEIVSPLKSSDVKATIRKKKKGWLEVKNGARGWIIGPFVCLWFSAFDKYGPMLFGVISSTDQGTCIRGRAGSDLNGVLIFSLLIPFIAFLVAWMIASDALGLAQLLGISLVFVVGGPFLYWSAHKDRRAAEPLVRFLSDTLTPAGRSRRSKSANFRIAKTFRLIVSGDLHDGSVNPATIHEALLRTGSGDFVILEASEQEYLQAASRDGLFVLEKRDGSHLPHYRALRSNAETSNEAQPNDTFTFEEILAAFMAYGSKTQMPQYFSWEAMRF